MDLTDHYMQMLQWKRSQTNGNKCLKTLQLICDSYLGNVTSFQTIYEYIYGNAIDTSIRQLPKLYHSLIFITFRCVLEMKNAEQLLSSI